MEMYRRPAVSSYTYFNCKVLSSFCLMFMMLLAPWSRSWGCDICAVYNSILSSRGTRDSLNVGVAQQFTSASSGIGGEKQYLESSITQPFLNYYFTNELSFQINVPLIKRSARRLIDTGIEYKDVGGIGDIPLLVKYQAVTAFDSDSSLIWEVFGGVKLPTGSTDELREHADDEDTHNNTPGDEHIHEGSSIQNGVDSHSHVHGASQDFSSQKVPHNAMGSLFKHGSELHGGLVDGHDLSLGSGSFDWLGGTSLFAISGMNYFNGLIQYSVRQEGDYGFRYGDDLQWHFGPGRYLIQEDEQTVGLRLRFSGEWKRHDVEDGVGLDGTGFNRVFTGPELMATFGNRTFLSIGSDFLIVSESAGEGVLPHTRVSAVLSHRF